MCRYVRVAEVLQDSVSLIDPMLAFHTREGPTDRRPSFDGLALVVSPYRHLRACDLGAIPTRHSGTSPWNDGPQKCRYVSGLVGDQLCHEQDTHVLYVALNLRT